MDTFGLSLRFAIAPTVGVSPKEEVDLILVLGVSDCEEEVEVVDLELGDFGLCSGFTVSIFAENWQFIYGQCNRNIWNLYIKNENVYQSKMISF